MDDLYQEEILDHYKNPRNFGELPGADVTVRESNASCGDMIEISVKFHKHQKPKTKNQTIEDIKFRGVGCAISMATASMLTEKIQNSKLKIQNIDEWGEKEMEELLGTKVGAAREKCVMLSLKAVKKALLEINK